MLLLDEPTAGLAQRETEAFAPLIRQIRDELDAAVLLIEHDMPLVMQVSDRVYCLEAGNVIAEGSPDAVRHDPLVVASYLGTDVRSIQRSGADDMIRACIFDVFGTVVDWHTSVSRDLAEFAAERDVTGRGLGGLRGGVAQALQPGDGRGTQRPPRRGRSSTCCTARVS